MATRKLEVVITGDASSLERALGKANNQGNQFAKTMGKAGVAGAILGLGAAVKIGVGEFMEAQKVTAQTNAVLKSTGGIANVTTTQIQGLSEALMKKSGVDDEAIQSGQNMLLTFTKIRNEVGEGNDVFDQATKATLDLSVAMGKDMQSSAILVGKALNDPIKGVGALSRAGVQLDADQKNLIKTMVASGNTMGAQKIILRELETQFGGSAEAAGKTFGGQLNIAKQSAMNFAGEMVARSIPTLQRFALFISEDVIPAVRSMWRWFDENILPTLRRLATVFAEAWGSIAKVLKENEPQLRRIFGLVEDIGKTLLWLVNKVVLPVLKPVLTKVLPEALNLTIDAIDGVVKSIQKVIDGFKWIGDNAERIWGKVGGILGKIPGVPSGTEFGPRIGPPAGVTAGLGSISNIGQQHGLVVTSGFRPGDPGDHGRGKALDISNTYQGDPDGTPQMDAAFLALASMAGALGLKDLLYTPGLWKYGFNIDNGRRAAFSVAGHGDHIHASVFDQGGWLRPGLTLAYNGTGRAERVVGPNDGGDIVIQVDGETLARVNRRYAEKHASRNRF